MQHLGIDFGTSNCSMSYCSGDKPELIRDASGLDKIPTVVYWAADGKHKVGQAALEMMYDAAGMEDEARFEILSRIVKSVKRNFFADRPIPMPDGSMVYPVDVAAEVLKYLKSNAEERCFHEPVRQVTLTHPVAFTEEQKELLRQAGEKAGFTEIELLEEPVAAARGYVATGTKVGNGILVYDLGGGTFDLAYVHRGEDGEFHIPLPPGGDAKCGGDDFDNLLYDYAEQDLKKRHGISFSENASETNLSFYYLCRQLKEKLSRNEQGQLRYFLDKHGVSYTLPVTRTEFNKLIENKIGNTIRLTGQMLNRISAAGYEVDTVLLIGASTRIPLVKAELAKILPVEPLETMLDDSAVALGNVMGKADVIPALEANSSPVESNSDISRATLAENIWNAEITFSRQVKEIVRKYAYGKQDKQPAFRRLAALYLCNELRGILKKILLIETECSKNDIDDSKWDACCQAGFEKTFELRTRPRPQISKWVWGFRIGTFLLFVGFFAAAVTCIDAYHHYHYHSDAKIVPCCLFFATVYATIYIVSWKKLFPLLVQKIICNQVIDDANDVLLKFSGKSAEPDGR